MRTPRPRQGPSATRTGIICALALACGALPAHAQVTGASIRIGPVTYNHDIGAMTAYGITVGVPLPILDVSGSLEYASKSVAVTAPLDCPSDQCPVRTLGFSDLAVRATAAVPFFTLPAFGRLYIGGGVGENRITVPDPAHTDSTATRWAKDTVTKPSYHAVAGGRVKVPLTRLGGFAEARVSWIQTDPVIRQFAFFVGISFAL